MIDHLPRRESIVTPRHPNHHTDSGGYRWYCARTSRMLNPPHEEPTTVGCPPAARGASHGMGGMARGMASGSACSVSGGVTWKTSGSNVGLVSLAQQHCHRPSSCRQSAATTVPAAATTVVQPSHSHCQQQRAPSQRKQLGMQPPQAGLGRAGRGLRAPTSGEGLVARAVPRQRSAAAPKSDGTSTSSVLSVSAAGAASGLVTSGEGGRLHTVGGCQSSHSTRRSATATPATNLHTGTARAFERAWAGASSHSVDSKRSE